jgi:hypothetical protein
MESLNQGCGKTGRPDFYFVEGAYYYLSMVPDKSEYDTRIEHSSKLSIDAQIKDNALALKEKL